jgi:hypothetical protein
MIDIGMAFFSFFGERKAHPPLGARESDAHGVEVVVTESHGSREPLGVG